MKKITTTLVIATYNWDKALELVLFSVLKQSVFPDEIIIADDGSTEATQFLIEKFKNNTSIPLQHVWHGDNGFRKSKILNKAILKAQNEYIIQVDGDCILHKHFIKDHIDFIEPNTYLYGTRVNIKKQYLTNLFKTKQLSFNFFSKGISKRTRALHIPILSKFYKKSSLYSRKFRGCNTSFFKKDFIDVNGYNEDITGWGREDSELVLRMHNNGLQARRLRYRAIVFHIYHDEKSRDRFKENDDIEKLTIKTKLTRCKNGINRY